MTEPLTEEPRRIGARVRDVDGHIWRRGRSRWSCEAEVGARYHDHRGRWRVVERTGRLPWYALLRMYGPLTLVDEEG